MRKPTWLPVLLTSLLAASALSAQETPEIDVEARRLRDDVWLIGDPEVPLDENLVASIGADGTLLIDTGMPSVAPEVLELLESLGSRGIDLIIDTHYHHARGNAALAGEGTVIVAHEDARARMLRRTEMYGAAPVGPWEPEGLPGITLGKGDLTLHFNGDRVRIRHLPHAHTDGDLVVELEEAGVLVAGDVYVPMLAPCDLHNGGRWDDYLAGVDELVEMAGPDTIVVPGHAEVGGREELLTVRRLLREITATVRERVAAGMDRDEVVAAGLPEPWDVWAPGGIGADFFLGNVFDGVTRR